MVKIRIGNVVDVANASQDVIDHLTNIATLDNPAHAEALRSGRSTWGINEKIVNFQVSSRETLLLPVGMIDDVIDTCKSYDEPYEIEDCRKLFSFTPINSKIEYRDYQLGPVKELMSKNSGILVAPAGSGKTVMGLSLIPIFGQPTLWVTHTGPLLSQTADRASEFLEVGDIGIIGQGRKDTDKFLTIGLVQTLVKMPDMLGRFGLVIVDEAHHVPSRTFIDVARKVDPYYFYGLTATPFRRDGLEDLMYQGISYRRVEIDRNSVVNSGGIIKPIVKCRAIVDDSGAKDIESDQIQRILSKVVQNVRRNKIIVDDIIKEVPNPTMVVSDRKKHCEELMAMVKRKYDKVDIATGSLSKKNISKAVKRFKDGKISILFATIHLLGEGFDAPFANRLFLASPFRARGRLEQLIGRISRSHKGKNESIIFDYYDKNIPVLYNQFTSKYRDCRMNVYKRLCKKIEMVD